MSTTESSPDWVYFIYCSRAYSSQVLSRNETHLTVWAPSSGLNRHRDFLPGLQMVTIPIETAFSRFEDLEEYIESNSLTVY